MRGRLALGQADATTPLSCSIPLRLTSGQNMRLVDRACLAGPFSIFRLSNDIVMRANIYARAPAMRRGNHGRYGLAIDLTEDEVIGQAMGSLLRTDSDPLNIPPRPSVGA